jgi:putative ABC transport system substrate-binding protein
VFIAALAGAGTWPLAARAQQAAMPVVGFLNGASPEGFEPYTAAFRAGLKEGGYIEGQNVLIEYRWADGHYDRLPALAAELVRRPVAVLAATSTPGAMSAKAATTTIPIVFTTASNPVKLGLVASLSRPGGNVTGATQLGIEVAPKRLELLHELLPAATTMALLVNPTGPIAEAVTRDTQVAARALGIELHVIHASTESHIDEAFAKVRQLRAGGLVIGTDTFFSARYHQLARLALGERVPTIYQYREFTAAGGLVSYGGSITDSYRTAGLFTARILNGEKPADLPVQQSTKLELVINLRTAKALGVTLPLSLLGRADEVIE